MSHIFIFPEFSRFFFIQKFKFPWVSLRFWQFFKFPEFSRFSVFSRFVEIIFLLLSNKRGNIFWENWCTEREQKYTVSESPFSFLSNNLKNKSIDLAVHLSTNILSLNSSFHKLVFTWNVHVYLYIYMIQIWSVRFLTTQNKNMYGPFLRNITNWCIMEDFQNLTDCIAPKTL